MLIAIKLNNYYKHWFKLQLKISQTTTRQNIDIANNMEAFLYMQ